MLICSFTAGTHGVTWGHTGDDQMRVQGMVPCGIVSSTDGSACEKAAQSVEWGMQAVRGRLCVQSKMPRNHPGVALRAPTCGLALGMEVDACQRLSEGVDLVHCG